MKNNDKGNHEKFQTATSRMCFSTLRMLGGLIKKGLHQKSIEVGGDDLTITFDYKGRPEFELRLENN